MKSTISRLLEHYETGRMSRRDLVQGLAVFAPSAGAAQAAGFQGNSINHISLFVGNLERSPDFYQRAFGCSVNKRDGNNQLVFGKNFLVLRTENPPGKVDHFGIGVDNFNQDAVTADLKARGITPINQQGGNSVSTSWTRTDFRCRLAGRIRPDPHGTRCFSEAPAQRLQAGKSAQTVTQGRVDRVVHA